MDRITEGKEPAASAKAEGGTVHVQKGYLWTGEGQLFFENQKGVGAGFSCTFRVENEELSQLTLRMTYSYDFGIYRILLDDEEVREREDFFLA